MVRMTRRAVSGGPAGHVVLENVSIRQQDGCLLTVIVFAAGDRFPDCHDCPHMDLDCTHAGKGLRETNEIAEFSHLLSSGLVTHFF